MTSDDPHIYFSTSDGQTWTRQLPETVVRDLALCRAIDALEARLRTTREAVEQAQAAVRSASPDMPAAELLAAWSGQTSALADVIAELSTLGAATIEAAQRSLFLK